MTTISVATAVAEYGPADTLLVPRAADLRQRIDQLEQRRKWGDHGLRFKTRADELERAAVALAVWVTVLERFRFHAVRFTTPLTDAAPLRKFAAQVAAKFSANPESIVAPDPMLKKTFWDPLAALPKQLSTAMEGAWVASVQDVTPASQAELLDVLGLLPGFREQVAHIRGLYRELERLGGSQTLRAIVEAQMTVEGETELVDAIDHLLAQPPRLVAEITTALRELTGDGIPDEVLVFLRQATVPPGAHYAQVTPITLTWLNKHDLVGALRVRLGSGS